MGPPFDSGCQAAAERVEIAAVEPIVFQSLYQERVWGGRELEHVYDRTLPQAEVPYGEAWEVVDREPEQSVVDQGEWAGRSLHELWTTRREELFGAGLEGFERFPLLIKILDARDDLSIQVHPPAPLAATMGGEPKTEMWFLAACEPGARLYVGLKHGVTRADFEAALHAGTVADCVHALTPQPGESIFIRSGRIHAIGAGVLIFEIQQNSDTTYRVFDWNRQGLDGKPRALHVAESLASIDFDDYEPTMDPPNAGVLADCEFFKVVKHELADGERLGNPLPGRFSLVAVVAGTLQSAGGRRLAAGTVAMLPRAAAPLTSIGAATVLQIVIPESAGPKADSIPALGSALGFIHKSPTAESRKGDA